MELWFWKIEVENKNPRRDDGLPGICYILRHCINELRQAGYLP